MKKSIFIVQLLFVLSLVFSFAQSGNSFYDPIPVSAGTHIADNSNGPQWFKYVPSSDKKIKISTCGLTNEDTYFIVYDSLQNWVAYSNNDCNNQSEKTFFVKGGYSYYICWANYYTSGTYQWTLTELTLIPGEFCENAISAQIGTNTADHSAGVDQWFKFTATKDGKIRISTCGQTNISTYANIYKGCGYIDYIYKNEKFCGTGQREIEFPVFAGETYYIHWQNVGNNGTYTWTLAELDVNPGEFCEYAINANLGTNVANNDNGPQWFKYTPTKECKVTVSNCGSISPSPTASIYPNCSMHWMHVQQEFCGENYKYSFYGEPGKTYFIKWNSLYPTGNYNWSIEEIDLQPGESCSNAITAINGINIFDVTNFFNSIQWYKYTATKNGKIIISNCISNAMSIEVRIYNDCNGDQIYPIYSSCGNQKRVIFDAEQGKTYYIAWQSYGADKTFNWTLEENEYQPGDICELAKEAQIGLNNVNLKYHYQWFKYTPTKDCKIKISNCESSIINSYVNIYSSCNYGYASYYTENCGDKFNAYILAEAGKTYYLHWYNYSTYDTFNFKLEELDLQPGEICKNSIQAQKGTNIANLSNHIQWFKYTPTKYCRIIIDNCNTTAEYAYPNVFSDCNDNYVNLISYEECGNGKYKLAFHGEPQKTYYIKWESWNNIDTMHWRLQEIDPVPGEFCLNPLTAVKGTNNVDHSELPFIWFTYTPQNNGKVTISAECNDVTSALSMMVLDTCIISLDDIDYKHVITYYSDFCGIDSFSFECQAGKTYYILSENWYGGNYSFVLKEGVPLPGEFCSNPIIAVKGTNEANLQFGAFLWFEYTAQNNGKIVISTECNPTTQASVVGILTKCVPLGQIEDNLIAAKENFCNGNSLSFPCKAGEKYKIVWFNEIGGVTITWNLDEQNAIPGEFCEYPLTPQIGTNHNNHNNSQLLWYEYTPTQYGVLTVSAQCNNVTSHTYMAVLDRCVPMNQIPDSAIALIEGFCDGENQVVINCIPGVTYKIGWYNPYGEEYDWNLSFVPYPEGEICQYPKKAILGDNTSSHTNSPLQWFEYTPDRNGTVIISANCNNFPQNTHMAVIDNCMPIEDIPGKAIALVENFCNQTSQVQFSVQANKKYIIGWYNENGVTYSWNLTLQSGLENIPLTNNINLYPNPNNGTFTIEVNDEFINSEIKITSINGQIVYNKILTEKSSVINLSQLKSGVYLISINNGKNIIREKLVIN